MKLYFITILIVNLIGVVAYLYLVYDLFKGE